MSASFAKLNLIIAWLWVLLGFVSGLMLGLRFHRDDWLGGYASWKRRLYRLGHISFFGLGLTNLMFYLTAAAFQMNSLPAQFAAWAFIVGALTMPACCLVVAHFPKSRMLFAIPIVSLIGGGGFTLLEVARL